MVSVIASTGSLVWTSPPVFSYVMLWMVFVFVTFIIVLILLQLLWWDISPPRIERIHANDSIIRMRLDD
jgi:hypothetical protein